MGTNTTQGVPPTSITHDMVAEHLHRYDQLHLHAQPDAACWAEAAAAHAQVQDDLHTVLQLLFGWRLHPKGIDDLMGVLQKYMLTMSQRFATSRDALMRVREHVEQKTANTTEFVVQSVETFLAHQPAGHAMLPPGVPLHVPVRNPTLGSASDWELAPEDLLPLSIV